MDIQTAIASIAPKSKVADKAEKVKDAAPADGLVGAEAFSQLLHGLRTESDLQGVDKLVPEISDAAALTTEGALGLAMQELGLLRQNAQEAANGVLSLATPELLPLELSLQSLVRQTQHLDSVDADAAMQDGSFVQARQDAGLKTSLQNWNAQAQPGVAVGQTVATVAAGVQSAVPAAGMADAGVGAAVAAALATADATDAGDNVAQSIADALQGDADGEGKFALQGAWRLEDPQAAANPTLQRVMGQMEQWAVATAGIQPKAVEAPEGGKGAGSALEGVSAMGAGSGTRLTDAAVKETQATQDAVLDSAAEPPVEDMRFWLDGKQQRAEVVLEKDGQPVRVQVMVRGNEAHVTFRADQLQTRDLLDASLSQLREMLQQQGVQLAGVSVQADAQGQGQASSDHGARNPWSAGAAKQGQVAVPVQAVVAQRARSVQGVDFYA